LVRAADAGAPPSRRDEIPTPALLLDLDQFEANLKTLNDQCRRTGRVARPHAKTHKCPEIARRQVAAGAVGVSVATVPEAEAMAAGGIKSLLLTSPILDPRKAARMAAIAKTGVEVLIAIGHPQAVPIIEGAAAAAGVKLNALLDLDVGDARFGIPPGDAAMELARMLAAAKSLRLRGVQAYAGLSSHVVGFSEREKSSREAMGMAAAMRRRLEAERLIEGPPMLSGGSTGTYNIDTTIDGVTELQSGSYVFMDVGYMRIGGRDGDATYRDFRPSLSVLTTVVSTSHPDRATVDAGIKAFSTDTEQAAQAVDRPGLRYRKFGDEFGLLTADPGVALPRLGERLAFHVPHCDPTVNLYDRIHALRGDRVEGVWPIAARREWEPSST
jgi:D-serine deaminase-like pyridoxal phosphate-dependent protein